MLSDLAYNSDGHLSLKSNFNVRRLLKELLRIGPRASAFLSINSHSFVKSVLSFDDGTLQRRERERSLRFDGGDVVARKVAMNSQ